MPSSHATPKRRARRLRFPVKRPPFLDEPVVQLLSPVSGEEGNVATREKWLECTPSIHALSPVNGGKRGAELLSLHLP